MKINEVPKTPKQVWRELSTEQRAFRVGVALRITWELVKPVLAWTVFVLAVGVWAILTVIVRGLSGKS